MNKMEFVKNEKERLARIMKSPEALAEFAVERTLAAFLRPDPRYKQFKPIREFLDRSLICRGSAANSYNIMRTSFMETSRRGAR